MHFRLPYERLVSRTCQVHTRCTNEQHQYAVSSCVEKPFVLIQPEFCLGEIGDHLCPCANGVRGTVRCTIGFDSFDGIMHRGFGGFDVTELRLLRALAATPLTLGFTCASRRCRKRRPPYTRTICKVRVSPEVVRDTVCVSSVRRREGTLLNHGRPPCRRPDR